MADWTEKNAGAFLAPINPKNQPTQNMPYMDLKLQTRAREPYKNLVQLWPELAKKWPGSQGTRWRGLLGSLCIIEDEGENDEGPSWWWCHRLSWLGVWCSGENDAVREKVSYERERAQGRA